MPVHCVWMTTATAAASSTVAESFFLAARFQGGTTYYRECEGAILINATLANAISAAQGGDPVA